MINMLKAAPFPSQAPLDAEKPWSLGIDFDYLKMLKTTMETKWKWEDIEAKIGKYDNFLVDYKSEDGVDEMDGVPWCRGAEGEDLGMQCADVQERGGV